MLLKNYKKIVIKIGSTTIVDQSSGKIRTKWLHSICEDIVELANINKKIAIVSSGAIALGKNLISNYSKWKRFQKKNTIVSKIKKFPEQNQLISLIATYV